MAPPILAAEICSAFVLYYFAYPSLLE